MPYVAILDEHLCNIADSIREKTQNHDIRYKPGEMAAAIANLPTGGGVEVEPIVLSGNCTYACSGAIPSTYIKLFGDTITTKGLYDVKSMFQNYQNDSIPFELNMSNATYREVSNLFYLSMIKEVPKINNLYIGALGYMFSTCRYLKEIPEGWTSTWNWDRLQTYQYIGGKNIFTDCSSLRYIDTGFLKNYSKGIFTTSTYNVYDNCFQGCCVLDEIPVLGVLRGAITSNYFAKTFDRCYRLKKLKFDMNEDGTPQTAKWKSQTIDLTTVGFGGIAWTFEQYMDDSSFGIVDTATYEAYKDNPDCWTSLVAYSRYNHDSAVETINSLPDTSAYGTNTIKFAGEAGSATDGGAINTMTEEEIAVATAKGWTVSLV